LAGSATLDLSAQDERAMTPAARLVSLDAFRGLTIAAMVLVNNPGSWAHVYPPLAHAEWHGWTPTDLIFPFFLYIVGVAMVFSFAVRAARGVSRAQLLRHTLRRSAILILLGWLLAGIPYFRLETMRIPGVLQRIGLCYFFASSVFLFLSKRGRIAGVTLLLLGYWALMMRVPVPGFGTGRLDPEGNLAAFIDRALMAGHLWKPKWDPEGLLSTLPAIATTLLGTFAGEWLRSRRSPQHITAGLLFAGSAGAVVGLAWGQWFPINKNLWTSSYVLLTAGLAAQFLAACYWLIDVRGWRRWAEPFVVYGMNAITVFFFSGLMAKMMGIFKAALPDGRVVSAHAWIFRQWFLPLADPLNASLLFAVSYVLFWLAMMWALYRARLFIKI
jgi:predicted acyltransferase